MRRNGIPRWLVILAVLAAVAASSGCKKKERQQAGGGGEPIRLNALAEIENYKEILRKDPNNLQALIGIGNLYYDTKQDLLAIENYQKALALGPSNVNVRTDMGMLPEEGEPGPRGRGAEEGHFHEPAACPVPLQPGGHPDRRQKRRRQQFGRSVGYSLF